MNTQFPTKNEIPRNWHVIDAEGVVLGRLASKAAMILMGKTKPIYTPFIDTGDHVIVINAEKIKLTGAKEELKIYRRHSGFPGGLSEIQANAILDMQMRRLVALERQRSGISRLMTSGKTCAWASTIID